MCLHVFVQYFRLFLDIAQQKWGEKVNELSLSVLSLER